MADPAEIRRLANDMRRERKTTVEYGMITIQCDKGMEDALVQAVKDVEAAADGKLVSSSTVERVSNHSGANPLIVHSAIKSLGYTILLLLVLAAGASGLDDHGSFHKIDPVEVVSGENGRDYGLTPISGAGLAVFLE